MKHINLLKVLRVFLAILFFSPILLFFVDFADKLPNQMNALAQIQLLPAILNGMFTVVAILFLLTLLFGRIYCSVICPSGVLQDLINRLFSIGKKKKKGIHRFRYHKPLNWFRYILLTLTGTMAIFGFMELCIFLDPYSSFGRIASNLFRPVVIWVNNLIADGLVKMGNYSLFHTTITTVTTTSLIAAGITLVVLIILVVFHGRLFCNTLCPVGAVLSLVSRYSFFRVSFVKEKCIQCKSCEHTCKAEAIDMENMTVDMSRCVDCFNCLSSCKKNAIKYQFKPFFVKEKEFSAIETNNSRRAFIATGATVAVSLPIAVLNARQKRNRHCKGDRSEKYHGPVTPPGSLNLEHFKNKCTACHLCVTQCPSHVLRPVGMEYGFSYLLRPEMSYVDSYCNYSCTVCSEVCPTGAIKPITVEEKKTIQVGVARFYINRCIVKTEETDCGACSEHCPTQAVHMVPYKGTLTIPKVEQELCIGCGGCESICPVRPHRAILIEANEIHIQAEKPKEEQKIEVEVDEFGF